MTGFNNKQRQVLKLLGISIFLAANIFLFMPFTLYVGNLEEFTTPVWTILFICSNFALGIIILLVFFGGFLREEQYRYYIMIIAVIGILLWLQGNVIVWDYGLLDGKNIDWTKEVWRGWTDLGIWLVVIAVAIYFFRAIEESIFHLAVAIFSLQFAILVFTCIQNTDALLSKAKSYNTPNALNEIYRFSPELNVLHIILDSFQADIFNEIINDEKQGESYKEALDGFIFFKEHMGVFPTTYMSVPALLSGEIYRNHMSKKDFVKSVISGKTILNAAYSEGYEIDLVGPPLMISFYTNGDYTNSYILSANFHLRSKELYVMDEALKILDLSLFRISPHFLKKYIYNDQRWFVRPIILDTEFSEYLYFAHNAFLNNVTHNMSVTRNRPTYKLFHLMNTHWPLVVDGREGKCNYAGQSLPIMRLTVTWQQQCVLKVVIKLLDKMKELDIYDNSLIVIMSDHGAQIPPLRFKPQIIVDSVSFKVDPWITAQVTPLMLIKPPKVSGVLEVSDAPTSMADTAVTIKSVLNLNEDFPGRSMLDIEPSEQRVRSHYFYDWSREDWETDYTGPIQEFIINGSIYDNNDWRLGKEYLPPAHVN